MKPLATEPSVGVGLLTPGEGVRNAGVCLDSVGVGVLAANEGVPFSDVGVVLGVRVGLSLGDRVEALDEITDSLSSVMTSNFGV